MALGFRGGNYIYPIEARLASIPGHGPRLYSGSTYIDIDTTDRNPFSRTFSLAQAYTQLKSAKMSHNKQEQHSYPSPHLLPQPYNFQSFSASTSPVTSTAMPSMVTSPAMSPFDPAIGDTELITPLTSVNVTPADALKKKDPVIIEEDDEIFSLDADTDEGTVVPAEGKVMAGTSYEADRDELKRRVWESVHGKGKQVESWGHRGASAVWRECDSIAGERSIS